MKIMVLDDEPFMLSLCQRILSNLGYHHVTTQDDALAALAQLQAGTHPDVILLDLNMPDMDGIEFLRQLQHIDYQGGILLVSGENRQILTTAYNLAKAYTLQVIGHLQKPLDPSALAPLLATWQTDTTKQTLTIPDATTSEITPQAIEQGLNTGQFVNFYQPQINIAAGQVAGMEALVRWQHPEWGRVPPDRFIGIAEQCGLIQTLTQQVAQQAIRDAARWQAAGFPAGVAINISMADLSRMDLPEFFIQLAGQHGLRPEHLTLEITESRLLEDLRTPLDILIRMRLKRIRLSIDDFGTGFSNLAQLMNLPFTELKIDRKFVQGATDGDAARAILESSVTLAKRLNMHIVAEGVETQTDWNRIAALGCDFAQGYLISPPLPATAVIAWLQAWSNKT